MVRYKGSDYTQTVMVRVSLDNQLLPGTLEFASQALIERRSDTAIFGSRYKHDETGCPADDPKILLKVILLASARGLISSGKIEQACRENSTFMALACGQVPDHSTSAAFVASLKEEIASLLRDILLVCAEQDLLGGTHFAVDGVKLASNAAKEWRGTFAEVRHKKAKWEEKVKRVLAQHERADKEEAAPAPAQQAEPQRRQDQLKRLEQQAARIATFLATNDPRRGCVHEAELYRLKGQLTLQSQVESRRGGGVFFASPRSGEKAAGEVMGAAGGGEFGASVATTEQEGRSPAAAGGDIQLVHRRL